MPYTDVRTRDLDDHRYLIHLLVDAAAKGMALVKIHSHPTGFPSFSRTDDDSDRELFDRVFPFSTLPNRMGARSCCRTEECSAGR